MTNSTTPPSTLSSKIAAFVSVHPTGHINPILSLVPLLRSAGWTIHFFCGTKHKSVIEATGAIFREDQISHADMHEAALSTIIKQFKLKPSKLMEKKFLLEQILPATVAYIQDGFIQRVQNLNPSLVVCDVSALWGIVAARLLKIPLVTSCSCTLFERLEPAFAFLREVPYLQESAAWLKETTGIEYDPMHSYMNESDFIVVWSFPQFQPSARQADPKVHFYGAALPQDMEALLKYQADQEEALSDQSVLNFIKQGRATGDNNVKFIYCTLGTVVGQEPWTVLDADPSMDMVQRFYDTVIQALGNNPNYRVILSIGKSRSIADFSVVPSNFLIRNVVPQLLVLSRVDAFITHCGNNSVHEAFFMGCPMICVPVFGDQHPNAALIESFGAGVQIASPFSPAPSPNLDHVTVPLLTRKLQDMFVTRQAEIRAKCDSIRADMLQRHTHFHSSAVDEITTFVLTEQQKQLTIH